MSAGEGIIMKVLRIFPRRTKATPDDPDVRIGEPTLFDSYKNVDKALISVTFTWDIQEAERLKRAWQHIAPVEIGGPALNITMNDDQFTPGLFLKRGYVITSRGCPNRCWFCKAWKTPLKELEIKEGNNILDDNLLACSEDHIRKVFDMLKTQRQVEFSGGLEAARLKNWHIDLMLQAKINQMFFAYDTPDDLEPLIDAGKRLQEAGYNYRKLRCYVLIGYKGDTFEKAEKRLLQTWHTGFMPFAMLYTQDGKYIKEWRKFQKLYVRPAITKSIFKGVLPL